jgi:flagellar hook-associated protein FlgK
MLRDPSYPKRQLNNFFTDYSKLGQKVSSDIATDEELNKYEDIKSFYDTYKDIQLDIVDAKADKNTERVNNLYKEIVETLKSYGYN